LRESAVLKNPLDGSKSAGGKAIIIKYIVRDECSGDARYSSSFGVCHGRYLNPEIAAIYGHRLKPFAWSFSFQKPFFESNGFVGVVQGEIFILGKLHGRVVPISGQFDEVARMLGGCQSSIAFSILSTVESQHPSAFFR
jgi:hypothetical protein